MDEDVLRDLLQVNPRDTAAAEALARLLSEAQRWEDVAQLLLERIELGDKPRSSLYRRLADVLDTRLGVPDNALVVLLEGLVELQDDALLGDALDGLGERLGQWDQILETYENIAQNHRNPVPFHRRMAEWYGRFGDIAREVHHREAILSHEPNDTHAIDALIAYYETTEDWPRLTRMIILRAQELPHGDERSRLMVQASEIMAHEMGRASDAFELIYKVFSSFPSEFLRTHIERYAQSTDRWSDLVQLYEQSARGQEDGTLDVRLARIYRDHLSDHQNARRYFARAAATEGWNSELAVEYRDLLRTSGGQDELARRIAIDLESVHDHDTEYQLLVERGGLLENGGDYAASIDVWYRALKLRPDNKSILVRLMDAFRETEQWNESVKVLKKLTVLETEPSRRAQYFHAIGVIQRDKLEDSIAAVRSFDQALEFAPSFVRAFHALDELLSVEENYERKDRYYRKMLVRSIDNQLDGELVAMLARNLGDLNRTQLLNYEAALKAYDIALKYGESDRILHKQIAELEAKSNQFDAAEETLLSLIESDPTDTECYHALVALHSCTERIDAAFNVCRVLRVLGHTTPDEIALYESVKTAQENRQVRPMGRNAWKDLESELASPAVGELLALLTPALKEYVASNERTVGVSSKLTDGLSHAQRLVSLVSSILDTPTPQVRISRRASSVVIGHLAEPVLVAPVNLAQLSKAEQIYACTRASLLMQPHYYLATIDPDGARSASRLNALISTVHQWLYPDRARPGAMPDLLTLLSSLGELERAPFQRWMNELIDVKDYGIPQWLNSVERIANRLSLAICDDVETAVSIIRRQERVIGTTSVNTRILDLIKYIVSKEYRELRSSLALTIRTHSP